MRRPASGREGLVGEEGVASSRLDPKGKVFIHGEYWDARAEEPVEEGETVQVEGLKGMVLLVRKIM